MVRRSRFQSEKPSDGTVGTFDCTEPHSFITIAQNICGNDATAFCRSLKFRRFCKRAVRCLYLQDVLCRTARQGVFRPVLRCLVCYRAFVRRPLCKRNHRRIGIAHRIVGGRQRHFVAREEICRTICIRHARSRQRAVVDADLVRLSEAVGRKAVGFVHIDRVVL